MQLIKIFPCWMTGGGIFSKLTNMPWSEDETVSELALDIEYFGNHAGHREASALLCKMVAPDTENDLTDVEIGRITNVVKTMYLKNWQRLWDANIAEYEPLENYNMVQKETPNITRTHTMSGTNSLTSNDSDTFSSTVSGSASGSDKTTSNLTTTTDDSKYGLGSSTAAPDTRTVTGVVGAGDSNKVDSTSTSSTTGSSTNTKNATQSGSNTEASTDKETGTRDLTRRGNIGVTTSQQMLESEINLWKWNYFETIFEDLDKLLTVPYWRLCDDCC